MKKLLVLIASSAIAVSSALAQGTLLFATFGGGNFYRILMADGTPASPEDHVFADLYCGAYADDLSSLGLQVQIQGNGLFNSSAPGNMDPVTLPGIAPGSPAYVQMVAWKGGPSYAAHTIVGAESPVFLVPALGGGTVPPARIPMGSGSLRLVSVPEPSTFNLALLGLGGIALSRRPRVTRRISKAGFQ